MRRLTITAVCAALALGCGDDTEPASPPATDTGSVADSAAPADSGPEKTDEGPAVDIAAPPPDAGPPPTTLDYDLTQAGPFQVGYRRWEHTYVAGPNGERTIDMHVWYPTEATGGEHPTYEFVFADPNAIVDAPPAAPVGGATATYPVHVYSHGNLGFAGSSAALLRHFASHGWVAVAPDHTGNTLSDNLEPRPVAIYYLRSLDITEALDAMEALPETDPLAGRLRTDAVVMSGHSFGVHTCWASAGATFDVPAMTAACADPADALGPCTEAELAVFDAGLGDPRVVASIPMAGSIPRKLFGPTGHESVTLPMLSMSGTLDPVGADTQFETTGDVPLVWIDIEDGCHQTFAIGECAVLGKEEGFAIVNTYALAFARRHVLGDDSASTGGILDGSIVVSDRVALKTKGGGQ